MEAALKIPETMSTTEFLVWDAPGKRWQLIEGVPQAMAPSNRTHGAIAAELSRLIGNHLRDRDSPCSVLVEPGIVPRVRANANFRIPDLGVTCTGYDAEEPYLSEPVLLIEILSPSNKAETWSNVWTYTSLPTVREILVVHSDEIAVELLRRQADGSWPAQPLPVREGTLTLECIEFGCDVAEFYRATRLAR